MGNDLSVGAKAQGRGDTKSAVTSAIREARSQLHTRISRVLVALKFAPSTAAVESALQELALCYRTVVSETSAKSLTAAAEASATASGVDKAVIAAQLADIVCCLNARPPTVVFLTGNGALLGLHSFVTATLRPSKASVFLSGTSVVGAINSQHEQPADGLLVNIVAPVAPTGDQIAAIRSGCSMKVTIRHFSTLAEMVRDAACPEDALFTCGPICVVSSAVSIAAVCSAPSRLVAGGPTGSSQALAGLAACAPLVHGFYALAGSPRHKALAGTELTPGGAPVLVNMVLDAALAEAADLASAAAAAVSNAGAGPGAAADDGGSDDEGDV